MELSVNYNCKMCGYQLTETVNILGLTVNYNCKLWNYQLTVHVNCGASVNYNSKL